MRLEWAMAEGRGRRPPTPDLDNDSNGKPVTFDAVYRENQREERRRLAALQEENEGGWLRNVVRRLTRSVETHDISRRILQFQGEDRVGLNVAIHGGVEEEARLAVDLLTKGLPEARRTFDRPVVVIDSKTRPIPKRTNE